MALNQEDLARTKRNVGRMVQQNAPQSDIDAYVISEGYTVDQVKNFRAGGGMSGAGNGAALPGRDVRPASRPRSGPTLQYEPLSRPFAKRADDSILEQLGNVPRDIGASVADTGVMLAKGARDAAVGLATLPSTLLGPVKEAVGIMPRGSTEKKIRAVDELVPDIQFTGPDRAGAELGGEIAQYAVPGAKAAQLTNRALKGAHKLTRYAANMLAAGGADFAVADPNQTQTIGNVIGGPTEIGPGDNPLTRRVKLGAEGAIFQGGMSGLGAVIGKGYAFLRDTIRPFVAADSIADEIARKTLRDFAHDPEGAAQRLAEEVEDLAQGGYQPTAGTASGDVGLLQLEKGLGRKPGKDIDKFSPAREFGERRAENKEAVSRQLRSVTDRPGAPEDVRTYLREEREGQLDAMQAGARQEQEALEQGVIREQDRLAEADAEVDGIVHELRTGAEGRTGAAKELDRTVKDELTRITNRKNELAGAIDPGRQLVVDDAPLRRTFKEITTPKGPFDLTPDKLPQGLTSRIRAFLDPENKKPLTFGDLQDLRPEISEAIKLAQSRNQRQVVDRLLSLRGMLNEYTEKVAQEAAETGGKQAAMAARQFLNYYKDIYVPRFKQGVGGEINEAILKGGDIPAETTAGRFIRPRGAKQRAAQDLARIAKGAASPQEANRAVRDYIATDFASAAVDPRTGKLNVGAIRKYLRDHREALREFPDVMGEIEGMARGAETALEKSGAARAGVARAESELQRAVKSAADNLAQNERAYKRNVASLFLDADPVTAVGQVFTGKNPARRMGELMRQVGGNQAAKEGLQAAVGEYLEKTLRGGKALRSGENIEVMSGRVLELMRDPQKVRALRVAFNGPDVEILQRVNRQLQTSAREQTRLAAGMPTHLAREAQRPLSLALDLHFGIMRGRRYLNFMNYIRTRILGAEDIETITERALTRMMLDPEAARIGLMPAKSEAAQKRLATYVMNNILAGEPDEDRRQSQGQ